MFFQKPYYSSSEENIFYLAPIPLYKKVITDTTLIDKLFDLGNEVLTDKQKRMGQELPNQYDEERYGISNYGNVKQEWVEADNQMPIGSRYFTPPNNFLNRNYPELYLTRTIIQNAYLELMDSLGIDYTKLAPQILESWLQYYEPHAGRGHNQHNHSRWSRDESYQQLFSGGLYLSDGEPLPDHPYSGVFSFHQRDNQYMIRPQKGLLLIWPSDIVHSVKPFYGKSQRAVINFNICLSDKPDFL